MSPVLERIAGSRYSRVLRAWELGAVAILAGGPSLTPALFQAVQHARDRGILRAIAINDSYLLAPWADLHYAADAKWHRWHMAGIDKPKLGLSAGDVRGRWASFAGERCSIQSAEQYLPENVHVIRNAAHPALSMGISFDPEALVTGHHGGFQALNLAILAGATTILLLGYDAKVSAEGDTHWHGDHPLQRPQPYNEFRRSFSTVEREIAAARVTVINCSLGSAIDSFPKMTFEQAVAAHVGDSIARA